MHIPSYRLDLLGSDLHNKLVDSKDKVLIEPLENHHFVQGNIEDASTLRPPVACQLSDRLLSFLTFERFSRLFSLNPQHLFMPGE